MTTVDPQPIDAVLNDAVIQLETIVVNLCRQLDPFPSFLGMATIQAIELDPVPAPTRELGCVVVTPDGELAELDVAAIPGVVGVLEVDQVEQFKPLDLAPGQYLVYLTEAVRVLSAELDRGDR